MSDKSTAITDADAIQIINSLTSILGAATQLRDELESSIDAIAHYRSVTFDDCADTSDAIRLAAREMLGATCEYSFTVLSDALQRLDAAAVGLINDK